MTEHRPEDLAAEQATLERAIEQRQRQIDEAATLAWCEARNEQANDAHVRHNAQPVATKSARQPMTNDMSAAWTDYIQRAISRSEQHVIKLSMEVVGEVLGKMRADLRKEYKAELEREVMALRNEFLQDRLDQERGVKRPLRVVPDAKESMIG